MPAVVRCGSQRLHILAWGESIDMKAEKGCAAGSKGCSPPGEAEALKDFLHPQTAVFFFFVGSYASPMS